MRYAVTVTPDRWPDPDEPQMPTEEYPAAPAVDVRLGERIPRMFGDHARHRIRRAVDPAPSPITSIRVRLSDHSDSAVADPIVAQADIFTSRVIRVQVTVTTAAEAVEALQARTRARLRALGRLGPIRWQHCASQASTLLYLRPVRQRTVIRTKTFHLHSCGAADAALEMALMDYPFQIFRETGVRTESVLYRAANGEYRLSRLEPRPAPVVPGSLPIIVDEAPAPELDRHEALDRLSLSGWPFLFYRDRALKRGCVLYHRYDGHYGLIAPRR